MKNKYLLIVALVPILLVSVLIHNANAATTNVISDQNVTCISDTLNNAIIDGAEAGKITVSMSGQTPVGASVDSTFVNDTLTQILKCLQHSDRNDNGIKLMR